MGAYGVRPVDQVSELNGPLGFDDQKPGSARLVWIPAIQIDVLNCSAECGYRPLRMFQP